MLFLLVQIFLKIQIEFHRLTNIDGIHQEIEEDDTIYVDRIIPTVNHVTNESNNNDGIYLPDYDVVVPILLS